MGLRDRLIQTALQDAQRCNKNKDYLGEEKALLYLVKHCPMPDPNLESLLSSVYKNLHNFEQYLYWLTRAALDGDVPSQIELGDYYYDLSIKPVTENEKEASAIAYLFQSYGNSFFTDYREGTEFWFSKAARQGNEYARVRLGFIKYAKNEFDDAMKIVEPLAQRGNELAQLCLGRIYAAQGNSQNAIRWLSPLAESGNSAAQADIGDVYFSIDKNYLEARKWLEPAAKFGDVKSQSSLGAIYYFVDHDVKRAIYWLKKAVEGGNDSATKLLYEILFNSKDKESL